MYMKLRLLIFLQLLCAAVFAQNPLNYLSSTKGGSCYEVCYYNNYLYAGCANTLIVFPTNGPNKTPGTATDSIRFISNIDYMVVRNGFLYICANHDGLWKYDVSNPALPTLVAHYAPASLNESVYDIAFYGDSIFVAAKTKVNLLKDNGSSFSYLGTVATYTGSTTRVRGVAIKDSLMAFTVGYSSGNTQDGVYLYNLKNLAPLSFYNDTQGDPQDVNFGQNTKLLHVMGGTISSTLVHGQYYALDYTVPSNPNLVFSQQINGLLLLGSISNPMNAVVLNDTVYVSTHGGGPIGYSGGPFTGQVYVFKATSTGSVSLLTDIYAGLYHFDTDIDPVTRTMYIASEWYGVLTIDINNIYSEVFRKRTNTGGWCHGSAQAKSKLIEASEGYGMRLFNVSNLQVPQLIAEDTVVGFCRAISISDSADYVYGWYLTGKRLRVRDANTLAFVSDTTVDQGTFIISDFAKSRYHNGKLAVIEDIGPGNKKIVTADVSVPAQAHVQFYRQKNNVADLLFHPTTGNLFALASDSILVFNTSTMNVVSFVTPPLGGLQPYKAFALSNDTLFVFYEGVGEGIAKYYFDTGLQTLMYLSAGTYTMSSGDRIFLAADNSLLYISSSLDSLKAITKTAPHAVIDKYNHGADHVFDNLWGNTDLYFKNGHLFLNEYMGQTSIFGQPNSTGISNPLAEKTKLSVYPNPASDHFTVNTGTKEECLVQIYDTQGKLMYLADVRAEKFQLSTNGFHRGLYFVSVTVNGKESSTKLLIEK